MKTKADFTMRNYHLMILALVCVVIVIVNRKMLLDTDSKRPIEIPDKDIHEGPVTGSKRIDFGRAPDLEPGVMGVRTITQTVNWTSSLKSNSHEEDLNSRLLHVNEICQRIKMTTGRVMELTGSEGLYLAYCVVPKAGCTMWLRVLQYIAGQGARTKGPMSLSKYDVHYRPQGYYSTFKNKTSAFLKPFLRAMTARDPYTRLWSAYIDKLLLPDFWGSKGKLIIKMVRPGPSLESLRCGHDVTFSEFIRYVLKIGHAQTYINQDKHWLPASDICDPCTFQPQVIGKQETFMDDFRYTVTRLGIPDIIDSVVTKDPVDFEIEDEIDYNFNIYPRFSACTDKQELCRRMWKAFQYNGYIPPSERFEDYVKHDSISKSDFLSVIRDVRTKFNVTKSDKKQWRKDSIQKAFDAITSVQKEELVKLYQMDFELFGYNSQPDYI